LAIVPAAERTKRPQ